MTPDAGPTRRLALLSGLAVATFALGWVGQGWWQFGGAAAPPAATATATDLIGGASSRQPLSIQLTLAVSNDGPEEIRVQGPTTPGPGTVITQVSPGLLVLPAGRAGQLQADVRVNCDRPVPLALPDLRIELIDGVHRGLPVSDSGLLLEACSRSRPTVRPLTVEVLPPAAGRLRLRLTSPTGRAIRLHAVRAGGVDLAGSPVPVTIAGRTPVDIRLSAPPSCPPEWLAGGTPSALTFDLSPDAVIAGGAASTTSQPVIVGSGLIFWLLAASCPGAPSPAGSP